MLGMDNSKVSNEQLRVCIFTKNNFSRQLSSSDLSRATKLLLYKSRILTVLLYGIEDRMQKPWKRKICRKIFGPIRDSDHFHIPTNKNLYDLLNDINEFQHINIQQLGQVVQMEENVLIRQVLDTAISIDWQRRRPCLSWMDQTIKIITSFAASQ